MIEQAEARRPSRLQEVANHPRFHPWVRAWKMESCQLYWLPVDSFPMSHPRRLWLLNFMDRLFSKQREKVGVLPQTFLKMGVVSPDLRDVFVRTAPTFKPLFGLGRHPGRALPPLPDEQYAKDLQKGKVTYDPEVIRPEYAYWLSRGDRAEQQRLFVGFAGTTTLLLPPPPQGPPVRRFRTQAIHDPAMRSLAERIDFNQKMQELHAIDAPFFQQSKEQFAGDLKDDPQYPGLLFALPLLAAEDFFAATPDGIAAWFQLFSLYLRESPEDKGILLASEQDIEEDVDEVLRSLADEDRLVYPA